MYVCMSEYFQWASSLMMVRPKSFAYNHENSDNTFARADSVNDALPLVLAEFDRMVSQLQALGLNLLIFQDSSDSPDAIFPNNWLSTHTDGTLVFYPMKAPSRRKEVDPGIAAFFQAQGFLVHQTLDWSQYAEQGQYLEGTGSLVIDWQHRWVYAALSERTNPDLVKLFAAHFGLELCLFETVAFAGPDGASHAVYHTNVLMAFAQDTVIWTPAAIAQAELRETMRKRFVQTKRHHYELTLEQMNAFMGNSLQVSTPDGLVLVMSLRAKQCLPADFIKTISQSTQICFFDIPTIETIGGGSVRCMLTEIFLPRL